MDGDEVRLEVLELRAGLRRRARDEQFVLVAADWRPISSFSVARYSLSSSSRVASAVWVRVAAQASGDSPRRRSGRRGARDSFGVPPAGGLRIAPSSMPRLARQDPGCRPLVGFVLVSGFGASRGPFLGRGSARVPTWRRLGANLPLLLESLIASVPPRSRAGRVVSAPRYRGATRRPVGEQVMPTPRRSATSGNLS